MLQAEQSLFPAELQLAASRASWLNASVSLYKAMGGGWVDLASAQAIRAPDPAVVGNPTPPQPWY